MSLNPSDYLEDFKNSVKSTLEGDVDIKNTASSLLTAFSSSKSADAASQISSFGISFGLSLLGRYLYTKKRGSHAARLISKILGAPVNEMNRDFVLQKMKDIEYHKTIRQNVLNVIKTLDIDEFAKTLALSFDEAWEVYRQIKDVVIDSEIIEMISRLSDEANSIESAMSAEAQSLKTAIEKQLCEVSRLREQLYETNGLTWLPYDYFEVHISTNEDIENWKKGFPFSLPSILRKKEFRRNTLISEIKNRLLSQHRLLLAGESGTSKSTILREILTDFFIEGYEILYNLDGADIKNGPQLVSFIENRLLRGDKILVVVDNAHTERTSAIFYVMDIILSTYRDIRNIMFLVAARIPEYDSFVKERLSHVKEGKDAIMKVRVDTKFRYDLPLFTKDEINGFIKKYIGREYLLRFTNPNGQEINVTAEDDSLLSILSEQILETTKGHPILVKFLLLGDGLHKNVEDRYNTYLSADSGKMQTMLVCSLLDIGSLPITDAFLGGAGLLREAHGLKNATLYQSTSGSWNTIHPKWDEELLSIMYNESEGQELIDNKQYLTAALDSIFYTEEDKISTKVVRTYTTIGTVYDLADLQIYPYRGGRIGNSNP